MIKSAAWELHKAVYQRLLGDSNLMARITGVYDHVSEDADFPYITIGEQTERAFDTKLSIGENRTLALHCWSQYNGKKESYEILDLMLRALTKTPLSLEGGFSMVKFEREPGSTVFQDIDGQTYHGVLRVRFYINN